MAFWPSYLRTVLIPACVEHVTGASIDNFYVDCYVTSVSSDCCQPPIHLIKKTNGRNRCRNLCVLGCQDDLIVSMSIFSLQSLTHGKPTEAVMVIAMKITVSTCI